MRTLRSRGALLAVAVATVLVLAIGLAAGGAFSGCSGEPDKEGRPSAAMSSSPHGAVAYVTAVTLARSVHPRAVNTWGEINARAFVFDTLQRYGYYPRMQEFISGTGAERVHSANIVAVKDGESAQQLVIGAHYDSAGAGEGYTDNATGVGLLLEAAARLKSRPTPYAIVFVAFGAGEDGAVGAEQYARSMGVAQRDATLGMVNLDTVAGGARLIVTGRGGATWLRDDALAGAKSLGVRLDADTGAGEATAGETPFAGRGMVTATLTSAGWAPLNAAPRHTRKDSIAYIEKRYPGRVKGQLKALSRLLETLLTSKLETHL